MEFTEFQHAFISATYYRLMRDGKFPNYEDAFLYATRRYAEQRGQRMAQRAIRDGVPLDFAAYRHYGEWQPSEKARAMHFKEPSTFHVLQEGNDVVMQYDLCPWSIQYLDMGLKDGANLYCSDLDAAIARGFNPQLTYDVRKTMHDGEDCCIQVLVNGVCPHAYGTPKPENIRDFAYHCGHLMKTFSGAMAAIYGARGVSLSAQVLDAFSAEYGRDQADELMRNTRHDFEHIDG